MGSPIGGSSNNYRTGANSLLRPQRSLEGALDSIGTSSASSSHFGPSAIRFRSSSQPPGGLGGGGADPAFKDER